MITLIKMNKISCVVIVRFYQLFKRGYQTYCGGMTSTIVKDVEQDIEN